MSRNPDIEVLKKESEVYKKELQAEINGWVQNSKNIASKVMLIGGGLTLAYLISAQLLKQKKKHRKKQQARKGNSSMISEISHFLLKELSVFLLTLAKERLLKYLEENESDEKVNSTNP
ncbi:MAG: hypothetical protein AAF519_03165 [Bacteroidota bacterium]